MGNSETRLTCGRPCEFSNVQKSFSRSKDRVPLLRSGSPIKKRRATKAHPAGAVDLFRRRCLFGALAKTDPQDSSIAASVEMPGLHRNLSRRCEAQSFAYAGRTRPTEGLASAGSPKPFFLGIGASLKAPGRLDVYTQARQGSDC